MVSYIYNSAVYLKSIESKQGCSPESNWQEAKSWIMQGSAAGVVEEAALQGEQS